MTAGTGSRDDPHAQARSARDAPLLLHSLSLFREVFAAVYAATPVRTVVEIGVESGAVTAMYAELGAEVVYAVDPSCSDEARARVAGDPALRLVEARSPGALAELPRADLYVVDGDHNYAVVRREVEWILGHAPEAVVVLHDVLWPSGRRDQYYEPSPLSDAERHPSSADGPTVWHDDLTPDGFVGLGAFTAAVHAGGERNGVLTAVEDAVADAGDAWDLHVVPAVFGLGVLVRAGTDRSRALATALRPWVGSDLLAALENNRLALYTRVLALQRALGAPAAGPRPRSAVGRALRRGVRPFLRRSNG